MNTERSGFAVLAALLGVDAGVLRAVAEPWMADKQTPPISTLEFEQRLTDAVGIAARLDNTNLWEHAIRNAVDQAELPLEIPASGVPRLFVHERGKVEDHSK